MKNQRISAYLILGVYFVCGLTLRFTLAKNPLPHPDSVIVDIVKENDKISIHEHYSKDLIFEYSKTNLADSSAYQEFEELWEEVRGSGSFLIFLRFKELLAKRLFDTLNVSPAH